MHAGYVVVITWDHVLARLDRCCSNGPPVGGEDKKVGPHRGQLDGRVGKISQTKWQHCSGKCPRETAAERSSGVSTEISDAIRVGGWGGQVKVGCCVGTCGIIIQQ